MKNLEKVILGFILMVSINSFAQEYKFGKVSKEELLESSYSVDSSANAAILYENKKVYFEYNQLEGFRLIKEVFKRVKFYNQKGFKNASEKVFLYKNNGAKEEVNSLKGVTYSLIDGEIVKTKLKKEGIFEEKYSEYNNQLKFTMPALKEGSVIEYKYKIISPFVFNIGRIDLQYEIPIKKLDVKVKMLKLLNFKRFTIGYLPIKFKESVEGTGTSVNTITSRHVPAFKEEPYSGYINNYKSSIIYDLQFIRYPNGYIQNFSSTWEGLTKKIYENNNFGNELDKNDYFKKDIDSLLANITVPSEKVNSIYNFLKNKMTWNEHKSILTRKGVRKAYKENMGNSAEINLILTSMLSYAKLNANPIIVSTSDRITPLFPTLNGFNYVISRVKLPNGKVYYLDATDKYALPNILPDRVVRGSGRVIAKNGTSQRIDLRPTEPSTNRYMMQCQMDNEGMVSGKFNVRYMDYFAHDFRVANEAKNDESKIEYFKKKFGIDEIEEYTIKGVKEYGKGVSESFSFKSHNQIELIDNEIYFSPLLFLRDKENIFKSDEREYPIDFGHGFTNTYMVNIKVPEGYEVVELPKAAGFKIPENVGTFSFKSNVSNSVIQIIVNETVSTPLISAEYYLVLKQFYNQLIEKENEQIVLKKI